MMHNVTRIDKYKTDESFWEESWSEDSLFYSGYLIIDRSIPNEKKVEHFDSEDILLRTYFYQYDNNGNQIQYSFNGEIEAYYFYDEMKNPNNSGQNNLIRVEDKSGITIDSYNYEYNSTGYPIVRIKNGTCKEYLEYECVK